ncbi:hypothetical protein LQK89_01765 [Curtobacterium sp. C1]|nr:hypothetical protein [Curtobacterium sp. C1]UFU14451.1 hypothetical protein LQK89_01765 [Curtobacterium sp. C1]
MRDHRLIDQRESGVVGERWPLSGIVHQGGRGHIWSGDDRAGARTDVRQTSPNAPDQHGRVPTHTQRLQQGEGASAGHVHGVDVREDLIEPVGVGCSYGDRDDVASELLEGGLFRLDERSTRERSLRVIDVGDSEPVERRLRVVRSGQEGQDRTGVPGKQEDLRGT